MFDIVLSAAAEPSLPSGIQQALPALGPYPILQVFGGIAVLALGLLMWLRGEREGQRKKSEPADSEVHMHFDGPMVEALRTLKEISETLKGIKAEVPEAAKMLIAIREDLMKRIDETRHGTRNELHREVSETERKLEAFQSQLSDVAQSVAHLEGRFAGRPTRDR